MNLPIILNLYGICHDLDQRSDSFWHMHVRQLYYKTLPGLIFISNQTLSINLCLL